MTRLSEAATLIESSQDAAERGTILANLLAHAEELATLYRTRPDQFGAFLLKVSSIRGMKSQASKFMAPIKAMAKAQQTALDSRPEVDAAGLDTLTADLDVLGLMSPVGFRVIPSGVWDGDERIALAPVVLTGVTRDLETDALRWDLSWKWRGRWWSRSVERSVALDARGLQKLAEFGMPVNSSNASQMVRYLAALEDANLPLIRERSTTVRMGWLGPRKFQLGADCIGKAETVLVADGGLADMAKGWTAHGEWADWCEVISEHLRGRHQVQLAIYAAAVAPLLAVLDVDGFVVDWSGATSRGKTSALRVAASVWGHPDKLVGSWGTASVVGPQESAAFLHSLPLILDDTKRVGDRSDIVARMLYDLPAGRERLRGMAGGGLRKVKTWRTVLLSTGEKAVIDFSEDAGARARSLCIRGAPFGSDSTENRKATEALTTCVRANHGHLGRMLVEHIVERANYDGLRDRYSELRDGYAEDAAGSVSRRLGAAVAALHLAGELCHDLGCPGVGQMDQVMDVAWTAALQGGMDSDRPAAAFRSLYNWCTANVERFDGARSSNRAEGPTQGWAGRWERDSRGAWSELGIYPQIARERLAKWGFDRDYCLNEWARRGWLVSQAGRNTKKVRVAGSSAWLLVFDAEAVDEVI